MDIDKYNTIAEAMLSIIDYVRYIESNDQDENLIGCRVNFDLLSVFFVSFLLTQFIDEYFKVSDDVVTTNLLDDYVKYLVSKIAKKKIDGRLYLGDLSYKDEYTVIIKVRNKLAHGDFIIDEKNNKKYVVFEEHHQKGKILIDALIDFVANFEGNAEKYSKIKSKSRLMYHLNKKDVIKIRNEKDFDLLCSKITALEIIDTPIIPTVRTNDYINKREIFYEACKRVLEKQLTLEKTKTLINELVKEFKKIGAVVDIKINKISDLPCYNGIKYTLLNKESFLSYFKEMQINLITLKTNVLNKGRYQNSCMIKGALLNLNLIQTLKLNPHLTQGELFIEKLPQLHLFENHMNDILIAPILVAFSIMYQYGLESEYSHINNYSLIHIFEGIVLDFSKLNLDMFKSDICVNEKSLSNFLDEINQEEKKQLEIIDSTIEYKRRILKEYLEKSRSTLGEKAAFTRERNKEIEQLNENKLEIIDVFANMRIKQLCYDMEKYIENLNIITHIRNAIAHGNIEVDMHEPNAHNTKMIFSDYNANGELVYKKEITLLEFMSLFTFENYDVLLEFVFDVLIGSISFKEKNLVKD